MAKRHDSSSDRYHRGDGTDRHGKGGGGPRRKTMFKGVPVVPGIAMGTVRLKFRRTQVLSDHNITAKEVEREWERLGEAVRQSKEQLLEARAKVAKEIGDLEAMIFDAHLAILEDQSFLKKVRAQVQRDLKPVEVVVAQIVEGYYRAMSMVEDEHLRDWDTLIASRYEEYAGDRHQVRAAALRTEADEGTLDRESLTHIQLLVPVCAVAIGCHHHICRGETAGRDDLFKHTLHWLAEFYIELRTRFEGGTITPLDRVQLALRRIVRRLRPGR